jgi:hypothetical protein
MTLFLRYTETPAADLERNCSYHLADAQEPGTEWNEYFNGYAQELEGLCAFEIEADDMEGAIEKAQEFRYNGTYHSQNGDSWCLLTGRLLVVGEEGVIIDAKEIAYVHKGKYFTEGA